MLRTLVVWVAALSGCAASARGGHGDDPGDLGYAFASGDFALQGDIGVCFDHCSADGTQVVDCAGNTVVQCGAGTVCIGAACASPCDLAKQDKSSVGCEYWVVDPAEEGLVNGACLAAIIANTSAVPARLSLDFKGQQYSASDYARLPVGQGKNIQYQPLPASGVPAGQVAIVFLAQAPQLGNDAIACPSPAAYTAGDAASEQTSIIDAFHITSSVPVVAYDIYPYGGAASDASSATLLIPTSSWDTNYLAVDAWPQSANGGLDQPFIQIVANEDHTSVSIRPTADIVGGAGVAAASAGTDVTYQLAKGQVLQLKQNAELAGSSIVSNVPVGVWGGASCLNIDTTDEFCDTAHQQLFPVKALGHEYVGARYRDRVPGKVESPPWRIIGAVSGTQLSWDSAAPAGAPASLDKGQIVTFWTSDPFVVRSQDADHPFYLSGHMTGCEYKGSGYIVGDPEFVNVISPAQYLSTYDFFTDATMSYTHLVLTRGLGIEGIFHDVTLDCVGIVQGWRPVGLGGQYETVGIDLVDRGLPVGNCNNGFHTARSDAPFGLTVWGWDQAVSYAYPAGAGVMIINDVIIQ